MNQDKIDRLGELLEEISRLSAKHADCSRMANEANEVALNAFQEFHEKKREVLPLLDDLLHDKFRELGLPRISGITWADFTGMEGK